MAFKPLVTLCTSASVPLASLGSQAALSPRLLEMIDFCRVGVAMGNACDVLKEKANIVCKSIVDDGLEDVLKILFSE